MVLTHKLGKALCNPHAPDSEFVFSLMCQQLPGDLPRVANYRAPPGESDSSDSEGDAEWRYASRGCVDSSLRLLL